MSRQVKWRTGQMAPAGGPLFNFASKRIRSLCVNQLENGLSFGPMFSLAFMNWTDPAEIVAQQPAVTWTEAFQNLHPDQFDAVVQAGYDRSTVLSTMFRVFVNYKGTNNAAKDFCVAYRFMPGSAMGETSITTKALAQQAWRDIRMTGGWTYHRYSASQTGGHASPSAGSFVINVADTIKLASEMLVTDLAATGANEFSALISDGHHVSVVEGFIHILIVSFIGEQLAAGDIVLDIECFQTVLVERNVEAAELFMPTDVVG